MQTRQTLQRCLRGTTLALLSFVCACASIANLRADEPTTTIPLTLPPETLPDPADLITWPVAGYPAFAPESVGNLGGWLLDAPAGKHGGVRQGPDGRMVFEDGTPARFWGTTTCYTYTFPDKEWEIAKLADGIAARGYNLVRFHHNDLPFQQVGYLASKPENSSYKLNPEAMDRLDRFAAELIKRGIYLYVDCLDSRPLTNEFGIIDEFPDMKGKQTMDGWKGLTMHPKMIANWKAAVTEFLSHKNPYTGRTWAEEPALATVEIINENGPFWDWSFKVSESVLRWYDTEWNAWLVKRYGSREALDAAWTDADGNRGLFPDEDPVKGTVFRPRLGPILDWDRPYRSKTRGSARVNDYYRSLAEAASAFYTDAQAHIRALGFQGPVIGSHELQGPIDIQSQRVTGTLASHLYARPMLAWNARPSSSGSTIDGVDVKTTNWFSNLPRIKTPGTAAVNGEWAGGSPMFRADVNIAVAAAMAFQGYDQSLHFGYGSRWRGEKVVNYDDQYKWTNHRKAIGTSFNSGHDIPWMMANRAAAALFIRGDLKAPRYTVDLACSTADVYEQNLHAIGASGANGTIGNAALFLPLLHNTRYSFFDTVYDGDADVAFMTGRTASGDYSKAKHAVLVGDNPWCDPEHSQRDLGAPARKVHPGVQIANLEEATTFTVAWPYAEPRSLTYKRYEGAVRLDSIPAGAQAIGRSADGQWCLGWLDDRFLVLPNGRAYGQQIAEIRWLYRLYIAACQRWGIDLGDNAVEAPFYQSDTRELTIDWAHGTTIIDTPRTQGVSGLVGWRPDNRTADLTYQLDTPYANVLATSADGLPIASSRRILLTAVGRVQNTDEQLQLTADGGAKVVKTGKGPLLVEGLRGTVTLRSTILDQLHVYALDFTGCRLGEVPVEKRDGALQLTLSPSLQTVWFEVAADDVAGPKTELTAAWPTDATTRAAAYPQPELVSLSDYFVSLNRKAVATPLASGSDDDGEGDERVVTASGGANLAKTAGGYGNFKLSQTPDLDYPSVLRAQFGKVNREWFGGMWMNLNPPNGLAAEDVSAFGLRFKGDGTLPRDTNLSLTTREGYKYKVTGNLHDIFENDAWTDLLFTPDRFVLHPDFLKKSPDLAAKAPAHPNFGQVSRMDFSCVGPLMDQLSVGRIAEVFLLVKRLEQTEDRAIKVDLPTVGENATPLHQIPYIANPQIKADGVLDEPAWSQSLAVTIDEAHLPAWHAFGSHVVAGKLTRDEHADFWLLATRDGLALAARVDKGGSPIVAEKKEWWENDCVELFSDPGKAAKKPAVQLFLAPRTAALNRPSASDAAVKIGKGNVQGGYLLEAFIPWSVLKFKTVPTTPFGLELQVDFAAPRAGRAIQMVYATGTNEAWITASNYASFVIAPAPAE